MCIVQVQVQIDWWPVGASEIPLHPSCFIPHFSAFLQPSLRSVPHRHRLHPRHDRWLESGVLRVLLRYKEDSLASWPNHHLTQIPEANHRKSRIHFTTWINHDWYHIGEYGKCTVCCVDVKSAQDRGLVFWQTNSNAIILNDSVGRLSGEGSKPQNQTNLESQDALTAATATKGQPQKLLASSASAQGNLSRIHWR